jgi:hypothetical protein
MAYRILATIGILVFIGTGFGAAVLWPSRRAEILLYVYFGEAMAILTGLIIFMIWIW